MVRYNSLKLFSLKLVSIILCLTGVTFSQELIDWLEIPLHNPSFEEGVNFPSDWEKWGKGDFHWSKEAYEGKRAVALRDTDWSTGLRSVSIPVFADYQSEYTWYRCEVCLKTKNASGRIFPSIAWYGAEGWIGNSRSPYIVNPDTGDWVKVTFYALPPKGALRAEIVLRVDKEITGEVLYDNVKLYSLSIPISSPVGDYKAAPYESFLYDYPSHPLAIQAHIQMALMDEDEGDLISAISRYRVIAASFASLKYWALQRIVELSINLKDYNKAEEIAKALLQIFPVRQSETYYLLSEVYKKKGDFQKSLSYGEKSLKIAQNSEWFISRVKLNIAYALEQLGKYEEAFIKYKALLHQHKDQRFLAILGEAVTLYLLGKRDRDIQRFTESFGLSCSLLKEENTPLPFKEEATNLVVKASLDQRVDRNVGYRQLWSIKDTLQSEDCKNFLMLSLRGPFYLALSRCYLQEGDITKAIELWMQPLYPEGIAKYFPILLNKFAPILRRSPLPSQAEKSLNHCQFPSINGFFSPRGKEYPQICIIYPTDIPDAQKTLYDKMVKGLLYCDILLTFPKNKLMIALATKVEEEVLGETNLLIFGSASDNPILEKIKDFLPIKLGDEVVKIKDRTYQSKDISVVMSVPNPFNREKEALIIWSANPSSFSGFDNSFLDMPLGYIIFQKGFSIEDKNILEAGFFYEHPDRTYEPF